MEEKNQNQLMQKEANTRFGIIDPFLESIFNFPFGQATKNSNLQNIMNTDIRETSKSYILDIDLPGFSKKDIGLTLDDGYLTISAKQECSESKDKNNYLRRERCIGSCKRSFYVGDISREDVDARLENGILSISIPKLKAKPNTASIEIK